MKQDFTRIAIILDRSGSMECIKEATITGFNEFVGKLKTGPGVTRLKLVQFDTEYETVFDVPVHEAPELTAATFVPRGSTALLDAMGRTISELGGELAALPEPERPASVIIMTVTDGEENASQQYTHANIAEMIKHQQTAYSWQFMYLGANQDAIRVAGDMGISPAASMNFRAGRKAMRATFAASADAVFYSLAHPSAGVKFSLADRKAAMVEDENEQPEPVASK